MAVLCRMPTIQYSARRAWLYLIGGSWSLSDTDVLARTEKRARFRYRLPWAQRERHIDHFSHFCRAHNVTNRQKDARYSVGSNRRRLRASYCDVV